MHAYWDGNIGVGQSSLFGDLDRPLFACMTLTAFELPVDGTWYDSCQLPAVNEAPTVVMVLFN